MGIAKVTGYVVLTLVVLGIIVNSKDIARYIRISRM